MGRRAGSPPLQRAGGAEALGGASTFHPAPGPSDAAVAAALATIRQRVQRLLARRGLEPADDVPGPVDRLAGESSVRAGIGEASVQGLVALGSRAGRECAGWVTRATRRR